MTPQTKEEIIQDLDLKIKNIKTSHQEADKHMSDIDSRMVTFMGLEHNLLLKQLHMCIKSDLPMLPDVMKAFMNHHNFIHEAVKNKFKPIVKKEIGQ